MNRIVIDASVAAKWQLSDERDARNAVRMLDDYADGTLDFVAPRFFLFEVANVLNKAVSIGRLTEAAGCEALDMVQNLEISLVEFPSAAEAYQLARRYRRSVYDSLYLASAERLDLELWTGDRKLYNGVRDQLSFVRWIGDYPSATPQ